MDLLDESQIVIRHYTQEDYNCLMSNWAESYYKGSIAKEFFTPEEFHSFHRPIRERFFAKPNTQVLVCCSSVDPWLILGWIATESVRGALIMHYIYVKETFRGRGIAKLLMKRAIHPRPVVYTHTTDKAESIIRRKCEFFEEFIYIPNLV